MSINNSVSKFNYILTSTTQALPFPSLFISNSDLTVVRTRLGTETTLSISTHYTVSGAGDDDGGTITLLGVDVQVGDTITVARIVDLTQEVDFVNHDRFPAATHERALDKLTMAVQQVDEATERSLKFPLPDENSGTIPNVATRANKVLGFDGSGNPITNLDASALAAIIAANPINILADIADYGDLTTTTDTGDFGSIV